MRDGKTQESMMRATKLVPAAVIGLSLATAAKAGPVDLLIVSNSVDVDTENRTACTRHVYGTIRQH